MADRRATVTESPFRLEGGLLLIDVELTGPFSTDKLTLAVDTGTAVTTILPEVIDRLGYDIRTAGGRTTVTTAVSQEHGYWRHVDRIEALGITVSDFPVHVFDLHERAGIDGLLGLDFLLPLIVEFRFPEGLIRAHSG